MSTPSAQPARCEPRITVSCSNGWHENTRLPDVTKCPGDIYDRAGGMPIAKCECSCHRGDA